MIRNNITGEEAEWIGKITSKGTEVYIIQYIKDGKKIQEKWDIKDCEIIKMATWEME